MNPDNVDWIRTLSSLGLILQTTLIHRNWSCAKASSELGSQSSGQSQSFDACRVDTTGGLSPGAYQRFALIVSHQWRALGNMTH